MILEFNMDWDVGLPLLLSFLGFTAAIIFVELRYRRALRPNTRTAKHVSPSLEEHAPNTSTADPVRKKPSQTGSIKTNSALGGINDAAQPEDRSKLVVKNLANEAPPSSTAQAKTSTSLIGGMSSVPAPAGLKPKDQSDGKYTPPSLLNGESILKLLEEARVPFPYMGLDKAILGLPSIFFIPNSIPYELNTRFNRIHVGDTYPVTEMPTNKSFVSGTLFGRRSPKGYTEDDFYSALSKCFKDHLIREHRMELKGASRDYEPDMILNFKEHGLRIDIEIDEPYSGSTREPMHWIGSYDDDRDLYFSKNGWVVIRFAEIQVVKEAEACIRHIALVVDSLIGTQHASKLPNVMLQRIPRWTYSQAVQWSSMMLREKYLGVEFEHRSETNASVEFERDVVRAPRSNVQKLSGSTERNTGLAELSQQERKTWQQLEEFITKNTHLRFQYDGEMCLVMPVCIIQERARYLLVAKDLVWREERKYELRRISHLLGEPNPFLRIRTTKDKVELHKAVAFAMDNQLYMQLSYMNYQNELHKRTISRIEYNNGFTAMGYIEQHISAYCTYRKEVRTFKIDRITEFAILNLPYA